MRIALFGPPGVGKSTLINFLAGSGLNAFDLERIPPQHRRDAIKMLDNFYIAAADVPPTDEVWVDTIKVLLDMPQDEYDVRRAARDKVHPSKAAQPHHSVEHWLDSVRYDVVLNAAHKVRVTFQHLKSKTKRYLRDPVNGTGADVFHKGQR